MKRVLILLLAGIAAVLLFSPASALEDPDLPDGMAAMGDSVTRAINLGFFGFGDNPRHSWSTGYAFDPVFSHFERIRMRSPSISRENAHNNAVSGARVRDAVEVQLPLTLSQKPEYVTVLIGNNDACHATPMEDFGSDYRYMVRELTSGLPGSKVLLVSILDIADLKDSLGDSRYCRWVWDAFDVCPELFGNGKKTEDFRNNLVNMNSIIEGIADDSGENVKFVNAYEIELKPYLVSSIDCLHPNVWGQAKIAQYTWEHGFFN